MCSANFCRLFPIAVLCFALLMPATSEAGHQEDSWLYNRQGMFKVSQGDQEGAIRDFERACRLDPFNDTALANLACARNNLGVTLAGQKNFKEAIRQFEAAKAQKPEDVSIRLNLLSTLVTIKDGAAVEKEARELITLRPNDPDLIGKIAAAFQKTENPGAAITVLQEFADRVPDNARIHGMLGRLLYRNGEADESSFHLRRSLELDPDSDDVRKTIRQLEREAEIESELQSYSSRHFSLSCPANFSADWADELLELLEDAYREVGDRLNFYPAVKSQVLIMQTDDFRRVHDLPDWAGGVYDGRIRLPVPGRGILPANLRGAVMHEYVHHVIFLLSSGNCPVWLNEGLAQLFEYGSENLERFSVSDEQSQFSSLSELDLEFKSNPDRQQAAKLYRASLAAVARLVQEQGWQQVSLLLAVLASGESLGKAASEVLSLNHEQLEALCLQHDS